MLKPGKGERIVNGIPIREYLKSEVLMLDVEQPFDVTAAGSSLRVVAQVQGGGLKRPGRSDRLAFRAHSPRSVRNTASSCGKKALSPAIHVLSKEKYGQPGPANGSSSRTFDLFSIRIYHHICEQGMGALPLEA